MTDSTRPRAAAATRPFEGTPRAAEFIARIRAFIGDELQPLSDRHGLTHEQGGNRALLQQVWQRSRELGWTVALERGADGLLAVRTDGVPAGAVVTGVARHPLGVEKEQALLFAPAGDGAYRSRKPLPDGRWTVRLEISAAGDTWRGERAVQ